MALLQLHHDDGGKYDKEDFDLLVASLHLFVPLHSARNVAVRALDFI